MTREWQPGDVAMVSWRGEPEQRVMRSDAGDWRAIDGDDFEHTTGARPLVVIDPEDREQVERMDDLYEKYVGKDSPVPDFEGTFGVMQAVLREFANPTPPKCQATMTVFGEDHSIGHECRESAGHDGAHVSAGAAWTVVTA